MKKINTLLILIIVIWAILAIIFAFSDLYISIMVADVNYQEGFNWTSIGGVGDKGNHALYMFAIVIFIGSLTGHYFSKITNKNALEWQRIVLYFFLIVHIINFIDNLIIEKFERAVQAFATVCLLLVFLVLAYNTNWIKFIPIAISLIILNHSMTAISNTTRVLWDRVRYQDLSSNYSEYTPWYIINPNERGRSSFISIHTKVACLGFPILFLIQYEDIKKSAKAIFSVSIIGWAIYVAITRVVIGKHYASDVLFPIGFASVITILLYKIFMSDKLRNLFFKDDLNIL